MKPLAVDFSPTVKLLEDENKDDNPKKPEDVFAEIRFWRWDLTWEEHKALAVRTNNQCCFNHYLGLPKKGETGPEMPLFEWEKEIYDGLQNYDRIWIKKARGLGATEFFMRYMAWLCLKNDFCKGGQMAIVVGPNERLAIDLIYRFKNKIGLQKYFEFDESARTITINECVITAYPSFHTDTLRSPENMKFIFVDEADFFKPNETKKIIDASEGYTAKSRPIIVLVSTPAMPGGFYDTSEHDPKFHYRKYIILFERGMPRLKPNNKYNATDWYAAVNATIADVGWDVIYEMTNSQREVLGTKLLQELTIDVNEPSIYRVIDIVVAALNGSFAREYNGQYGHGSGDLFGPEIIDEISKTMYGLAFSDGQKVLAVDPAYGRLEESSKFAIVGLEQVDGIIYIRFAQQIERASPVAMTEKVAMEYHKNKYDLCLVDGSQTGLINDLETGVPQLNIRPVNVEPVLFKDKLTEMCTVVPRRCREKVVMIHPTFTQLINQLKACPTNDKGHPDKKKIDFDLGDAFLMGVNYYGEAEVWMDKL